MSRAEADDWAADSLYAGPVFHVTTLEAATMIRSRGFDLANRAGGRAWGDGIYATFDRPTLEVYTHQLGERGVTLELRVNVRRVLSVRISQGSRRPALEQVLALVPAGLREFIDASLTVSDRSAAFTRVITGAGYDALEIIEDRFTLAVGGSQLVIYDPRRVVVVTDENADGT